MKHILTSKTEAFTKEKSIKKGVSVSFHLAICAGLISSTVMHAQNAAQSDSQRDEEAVLLPEVALIGSDAANSHCLHQVFLSARMN